LDELQKKPDEWQVLTDERKKEISLLREYVDKVKPIKGKEGKKGKRKGDCLLLPFP
jgi:hypothetical protein